MVKVDATRATPPMVQLADGWRVHEGDDPSFAQPGFDDSAWESTSLAGDSRTVRPGWRWYRIHVEVPAEHPALALMIVGPLNEYQVYVNGTTLAGARIRGPFYLDAGKELVLPLPPVAGSVVVAIRAFLPSPYNEIFGVSLVSAALGPPAAIEALRQITDDQRRLLVLPSVAINLALVLAGFGTMLIFLLRRSAPEYLWLGWFLWLVGFSTGVLWISADGVVPLVTNAFLGDPLGYLAILAQIEFIYAFTRRRVTRAWRAFECLLLVFMALSLLVTAGWLPPIPYLLAEAVVNAFAAIVLPGLLFLWFARGDREAGWLILPSVIPNAANVLGDLGLVSRFLGWNDLAFLNQPLVVAGLPFNLTDLLDFAFLLCIGVVMVIRFTRVSDEQARTAAELDAAREIQRRLVPATLPAVASCRVEAAYLPALEVGGDFYQILRQGDGSSLILVGDVSGKGLKAAMTGVLTIGAARTLASEEYQPGALLTRLNRELASAQQGGFVTCLCIRVAVDGGVIIANAGHLAPYRNGEEVCLDDGLPLGLADDFEYGETTIQLAAGDRLTMMSDGVVEAQNAARELFGFERTRAISRESAEEIAGVAQRFGQEDDITVMTLDFVDVSS
jgi:hypothetical protein